MEEEQLTIFIKNTMTKQQKIKLLAQAFDRKQERNERETDPQFVQRVVLEQISRFRERLFRRTIRQEIEMQTTKEEIDVSDL